ncbi:hypothetical protein SH580_09120 [Coraliomargarita algicola]|uniref:Uncharacterized protein n=1 Tax=Coraliomargarita algicola TaxID=3092156 RepID=A0ABZ0RSB3_9BACT|nr:hypothetical protein [Coraliomargarita sp. J2-16]WPJ97870.1 hypothetical protein SH580_09120 [Coraliomargarita sp. J2-16]
MSFVTSVLGTGAMPIAPETKFRGYAKPKLIDHILLEVVLQIADFTDAGYQLYHPIMIERVAEIRELQGQRYTLSEIRGQIERE